MGDNTVVFPAPGEKERRLLAFGSRTLAGYEWPYFAISGATDGPTLGLIAGVHGAEYPPMDAVMQFCRALDPARLRGRVVAVPVVNLPAFWQRTPFVCPKDGKNPNRVFPGDPNGTFSEALAYHLFEAVIRRGHYLIDLHCGDLVEDLMPFSLIQESGNAEVDGRARALAVAFGLPYVVVQPYGGGPVAGTTNGAAAQAGIPAVIAEAGGVGQLDPKAVDLHLRGLRQALRHLGMLEGELEGLEPPTMIADFVWVRAGRGGFFRKALVAGDAVLAGHPLGRMHDLWGTPQDEILSPVDGMALFVTTSPAISDNGLIAGIGVPA
jgi:predicted deacylase